jgi:hypothetical protein
LLSIDIQYPLLTCPKTNEKAISSGFSHAAFRPDALNA